MDKYLKINDRIDYINIWKNICRNITEDNLEITLDDDKHIVNDISDFVEKLRIKDGSLVLLKSQRGTFGIPFETKLENFRWFTKFMIYDIDYLCNPNCGLWNGESKSEIYKKLGAYKKFNESEKLEFHKKIIQLKHLSINTEHSINNKMTELVLNKISPHICILYGATELIEKKNSELIKTIINKHKKEDKEIMIDASKVLMTEWANLGELADYIKENNKKWSKETWTVLLFQMIAMLALIQEKYPTFRHNDLSLSNILVQNTRVKPLDETEFGGYYKYTIYGKTYCIPDIGFRILLADFDYSIIKELNIMNDKVDHKQTKKFGAVSDFNQSFDCHMMLNWLSVWVLKLHNYNEFNMPPFNLEHIKDFIYDVIENKYRGFNNRFVNHTRLRNGKKIINRLIPKNLLENEKIFEKFRDYKEWIIDRTFIEEYNSSI